MKNIKNKTLLLLRFLKAHKMTRRQLIVCFSKKKIHSFFRIFSAENSIEIVYGYGCTETCSRYFIIIQTTKFNVENKNDILK